MNWRYGRLDLTLISGMSLALRAALTLVFMAAAGTKLAGLSMMVETFEAIGWGQWFRYVTAFVELGSAALLWFPRMQAVGAGLLMTTMICGALFHVFVIGPSAVPALILAGLCAIVVVIHRDQLLGLLSNRIH